jgi:O-antigen/teichoic acid export membrane protein
MDLSFRERSLWLMLLSLMGVFGFYFYTVLPSRSLDVKPEHIVLFVVAVVVLVIMQVVGHFAIALLERRAGEDERDRLIQLIGTRNAAYVLATGVFSALCAAMLTKGNFVFIHVLLGAWVLAQVVEIVSQLLLQRRGP